jgi:hypothetical protein
MVLLGHAPERGPYSAMSDPRLELDTFARCLCHRRANRFTSASMYNKEQMLYAALEGKGSAPWLRRHARGRGPVPLRCRHGVVDRPSRPNAGIARAKAAGKHCGRPFIDTNLEGRIHDALAAPGRPGLHQIAKQFGVGTGNGSTHRAWLTPAPSVIELG